MKSYTFGREQASVLRWPVATRYTVLVNGCAEGPYSAMEHARAGAVIAKWDDCLTSGVVQLAEGRRRSFKMMIKGDLVHTHRRVG